MPPKDKEKFPAQPSVDLSHLQQAFDTTFARSSTPYASTFSVKCSIVGVNSLLMSYQAVVNFGTEREMIVVKRSYSEESQGIINQVLKNIKKNYKDLAGETFTTKEMSSSDSLEMLTAAIFNPKRTAYYRRKTLFEIS